MHLPLLNIAEKIKFILKHVHKSYLVGKKIKIMDEYHQFESGLSSNIFQSINNRASKFITPSILTYLADKLHDFGDSIYFKMNLPKGLILMDVAVRTGITV